MKIRLYALPLLAALCAVCAADAQQASATITFDFENPRLQPASYTFVVRQDGFGTFHSEPGLAETTSAEGIRPQPVSKQIHLHNPLLANLFSAAASHKYFAVECEMAKNHVAFTGKKTFAYAGPAGQGSCTFNYSKDQKLNQLADQMLAAAFTIEEGRRLAVEHNHNRLSLDAELESLEEAVHNHQAIEVGNIAPELESIAGDPEVLDRARTRARRLLALAGKPE